MIILNRFILIISIIFIICGIGYGGLVLNTDYFPLSSNIFVAKLFAIFGQPWTYFFIENRLIYKLGYYIFDGRISEIYAQTKLLAIRSSLGILINSIILIVIYTIFLKRIKNIKVK